MQTVKLKYGHSEIQLEMPKNSQFDILQPPAIAPHPDPKALVNECLLNPLLHEPKKIDFTNKKIAIAINDKTRPVPHDILLPGLLEYIIKNGANRENITFFIATGTHAPMRSDEFSMILPPEIITKYQVFSHDCDDAENLLYIGETSAGTKVSVNALYFKADIKIVVGNIEPHHFMGYSGGVKSASIGLTSRETITLNHRHLVKPESAAGNYSTNPCRMDVEEIGRMIGVDYALNAILSFDKKIVHVLWGEPDLVFQTGAHASAKMTQIAVQDRYDLVIASAGGYPKDINLYQAQKALTNAASICRDGGDVFLIAECEEGPGNQLFAKFLDKVTTPAEAMSAFTAAGFSIGPHKAFQIARIATRVNVHLLSGMPDDLVKKLLFSPFSHNDLQTKLMKLPAGIKVAIMPYGVITIPK